MRNVEKIKKLIPQEMQSAIAAVSFWLKELGELQARSDLAYWCWSHHEAREITDLGLALLPEPERTQDFRSVHLEYDKSDHEIFDIYIAPCLELWKEQAGLELPRYSVEGAA